VKPVFRGCHLLLFGFVELFGLAFEKIRKSDYVINGKFTDLPELFDCGVVRLVAVVVGDLLQLVEVEHLRAANQLLHLFGPARVRTSMKNSCGGGACFSPHLSMMSALEAQTEWNPR